jgi:hypothetical protein
MGKAPSHRQKINHGGKLYEHAAIAPRLSIFLFPIDKNRRVLFGESSQFDTGITTYKRNGMGCILKRFVQVKHFAALFGVGINGIRGGFRWCETISLKTCRDFQLNQVWYVYVWSFWCKAIKWRCAFPAPSTAFIQFYCCCGSMVAVSGAVHNAIYKHAAGTVYTFLHIPLGCILKKLRQNASATRQAANRVFS